MSARLPWRYPGGRLAALASGNPGLPGPRGFAAGSKGRKDQRPVADVDEHIRFTLREESAATLGRAGSALQEAVATLAEFDRELERSKGGKIQGDRQPAPARSSPDAAGAAGGLATGADAARDAAVVDTASRRPLVLAAAAALWEYVVQREAMGLTRHDLLEQLYGVTPELWTLMGIADVVHHKARAVD